jgi:hypothetical protein
MKDDLFNKLDSFSDREIAFFFNYRLVEFQESVQQKIKDYIINHRHLDLKEIQKLLKTSPPPKTTERCSRCGYNNFEINEDNRHCIVCGKLKHKNKIIQTINYLLDFFSL